MRSVITAKTYVFDATGRLLVITRHAGAKHRPNGPDLPGGHIEPGEHYVQAALREADEETGLALDPAKTTLFFTNTMMIEGHNIIRFLLSTHLPTNQPAVKLSHEHSDYRWVEPADIDAVLHDAPNMLLAYHYGLHNHLL